MVDWSYKDDNLLQQIGLYPSCRQSLALECAVWDKNYAVVQQSTKSGRSFISALVICIITDGECQVENYDKVSKVSTYLIFVIFFTLAKFLEKKIYTEKRQFFALNL